MECRGGWNCLPAAISGWFAEPQPLLPHSRAFLLRTGGFGPVGAGSVPPSQVMNTGKPNYDTSNTRTGLENRIQGGFCNGGICLFRSDSRPHLVSLRFPADTQ